MTSGPADRGDNTIIGGDFGGGAAQTSDWGPDAERADPASEVEYRTQQMAGEAQRKSDRAHDDAEERFQEARARAERGREQAASRLGDAAEQLRSRSQGQGASAEQMGGMVADRLDRTSQYLHEHDTDEMLHDFQGYVRNHPLQAVAGATITGFVLARILP